MSSTLHRVFTLILHAYAIFSGVTFLYFGYLYSADQAAGLAYWELAYPSSPGSEQTAINVLLAALSAKSTVIGAIILIALYYRRSRLVGWLLMAGGAMAGVDGWACYKYMGHGQWGHWGYAPVMALCGLGMVVQG